MDAPEWNALLIAVGVGVAFWLVVELLSRWSAARRVRRAALRTGSSARRPVENTPAGG